MPFIPAAIGAALIGTGGAIGSSLLGSKLSKVKPTAAEQSVLSNQAAAQKMGMQTAGNLLPQGQNLIGMGTSAQQPVLNYWASLLSGNRGMATSAAAPELFQIGRGYETAKSTSAALNPRGGPTAAFNAELPFAQQRDVSTLLQHARPEAATNLLSAGQGLTGQGSTLLNSAIQAIYGSTAAGREILGQQAQSRQLESERGRSIGAGLFDLINRYGPNVVSLLSRGGGQGEPQYQGKVGAA